MKLFVGIDVSSEKLDTCLSTCETDWPDRSATCSTLDTSSAGSIYAYSPYLNPSYISQLGEKFLGWLGYDNYHQIQF